MQGFYAPHIVQDKGFFDGIHDTLPLSDTTGARPIGHAPVCFC